MKITFKMLTFYMFCGQTYRLLVHENTQTTVFIYLHVHCEVNKAVWHSQPSPLGGEALHAADVFTFTCVSNMKVFIRHQSHT